jgi:hypothetical protein
MQTAHVSNSARASISFTEIDYVLDGRCNPDIYSIEGQVSND